ncbi:MAG TPA: hypothetical protein VIH99_12825, partial [Bdellovibrionota bacterium]
LLGLNAPQGAGKTTISRALCERLERAGKRALAVSIDDFYYTRQDQLALATRFPGNPYLQQRGYPGTHDLALGERTLKSLKSAAAGEVSVPRYDKSAHRGQGDRLPESAWPKVALPLDFVIVEGWMLGFSPAPEGVLPNESFRKINSFLNGYTAWHRELDGFLQLVPADPRYVLDWRAEAERKMREEGKGGMSDEEVRAYAGKFLPAYETYLPVLTANPPARNNILRIQIGKNRLPTESTV